MVWISWLKHRRCARQQCIDAKKTQIFKHLPTPIANNDSCQAWQLAIELYHVLYVLVPLGDDGSLGSCSYPSSLERRRRQQQPPFLRAIRIAHVACVGTFQEQQPFFHSPDLRKAPDIHYGSRRYRLRVQITALENVPTRRVGAVGHANGRLRRGFDPC